MLQLRDFLRKWWVVLILGIINLITGICFLSTAGAGYVLARSFLEIEFLIMGIVLAAAIILNRDIIPAWGWDFAAAILVIIAGLVLIFVPGTSDALILSLYAAGFIGEGVFCIRGYFTVKKLTPVTPKTLIATLILGIVSLILGIILVFNPDISMFAIDFMVSFAIFAVGVSMIAAAFNMSKYNSAIKSVETAVNTAINDAAESVNKSENTQN